MYECEHCGAAFRNYYSLRSHVNGSVFQGIPRCARKVQRAIVVGENDDESAAVIDDASAVITTALDLQSEICRRHQDDSILSAPHPLHNIGKSCVLTYTDSVNYGALVLALHEYCKWILKSRSRKFWSLYLATRHLPQDDQRNILELVRKVFQTGTGARWCVDKRAVRNLLKSKPFWPLATYTYTCDLSAFQVPGLGVVTYTFVDPIFAWILQARKLGKHHDLLFRYREARRKGTCEQTWGSCVSCGEAMRQVMLAGILHQTNIPRYNLSVNIPGNSSRYLTPGKCAKESHPGNYAHSYHYSGM